MSQNIMIESAISLYQRELRKSKTPEQDDLIFDIYSRRIDRCKGTKREKDHAIRYMAMLKEHKK